MQNRADQTTAGITHAPTPKATCNNVLTVKLGTEDNVVRFGSLASPALTVIAWLAGLVEH
jgi:hypothetical protein